MPFNWSSKYRSDIHLNLFSHDSWLQIKWMYIHCSLIWQKKNLPASKICAPHWSRAMWSWLTVIEWRFQSIKFWHVMKILSFFLHPSWLQYVPFTHHQFVLTTSNQSQILFSFSNRINYLFFYRQFWLKKNFSSFWNKYSLNITLSKSQVGSRLLWKHRICFPEKSFVRYLF